eukprot:RCo042749
MLRAVGEASSRSMSWIRSSHSLLSILKFCAATCSGVLESKFSATALMLLPTETRYWIAPERHLLAAWWMGVRPLLSTALTSALFSTRNFIISKRFIFVAKCSTLCSSLFVAFTEPPAATIAAATLTTPSNAQRCRAVLPLESFALTSTRPFCSSKLRQSTLPQLAAVCSGVLPTLLYSSALARRSKRYSTQPGRFSFTATCSAVLPRLFLMFRSASRLSTQNRITVRSRRTALWSRVSPSSSMHLAKLLGFSRNSERLARRVSISPRLHAASIVVKSSRLPSGGPSDRLTMFPVSVLFPSPSLQQIPLPSDVHTQMRAHRQTDRQTQRKTLVFGGASRKND